MNGIKAMTDDRNSKDQFHRMFSSIKELDNGPVYIRENGKLHLVSGTGNFSNESQNISKKPLRLFQKGFSVTLGLDDGDRSAGSERKDHFIFVYTKEGNLRYTAKKLFDISLAFIAEHVQHIDSLIGFPEQVAKKLFFAVEERQKFVDPNVATKALYLFNEAYGELMLKSLCLRNGYLLLSEKLQEIKSFQGLSCLDLSSCKLGDDHDFLDHLTSDNLTSLLHLSLQDNCLSDRGLRKLTAPVRVMKRGLNNLKVLNLSCNPHISEEGVGYICCFKKLNSLDITGTAAKMDKFVVRLSKDEAKKDERSQGKVYRQTTIESLRRVVVLEDIYRFKSMLELNGQTKENLLLALTELKKKMPSKEVLLSTKIVTYICQNFWLAKAMYFHGDIIIINRADLWDILRLHWIPSKSLDIIDGLYTGVVDHPLVENIEREAFHQCSRLINGPYRRTVRALVFALKHKPEMSYQIKNSKLPVNQFVKSHKK
ncbi:LRC42 protein, partial [Polypterus senegalus]